MGTEWTGKAACDSCNVCMTSASASVNTEVSPLIRRGEADDDFCTNFFFVGILCVFLLAGVGIGTYLLISEGNEWQPEDKVPGIIERRSWRALPPNGTLDALRPPVAKILLVETSTDPCTSRSDCLDEVLGLQERGLGSDADVPYNFLVGGNGDVFEGRGWNYQCDVNGYRNDDTLTIGVLGTFQDRLPGRSQMDGLRFLIRTAVEGGHARRCHVVIVRVDTRNFGTMIDVAAALQADVKYC